MNLNNPMELYDNPPVRSYKGLFICPVCHKEYKRKSSVEAHMQLKDCYSYVDVFAGTEAESAMMETANIFYGLTDTAQLVRSYVRFRKTKMYRQVGKLFLYNTANKINDIEHYVMWGISENKKSKYSIKDVYMILAFLTKERLSFESFYKFRRYVITESETTKYIMQNKKRLNADTNFLIRSFEKGYIDSAAIVEHGLFEDIEINEIQRQKLMGLLNERYC